MNTTTNTTMNTKLSALILPIALAGCASAQKHAADLTAAADAGTTIAAANASHVVEANPLGYATIPLKAYTLHAAQNMEPEDCAETLILFGTQWGALSGWGWGLIGGAGAGPAGAAAVLVGGVTWYALDKLGGAERRCEKARPRTEKELARDMRRTEKSQTLWLN